MTYKALILPLINYACPVWYPNCAGGTIDKLQKIQNSALRIATGCHLKTDIDHLHRECHLLKVKDHLDLLCAQFLLSTLRQRHPSHEIVRAMPVRESRQESANFKPNHTLHSRFKQKVMPFLVDNVVPEQNYKVALKTLHTAAVQSAVTNSEPNKVILGQVPEINPNEADLPRPARSALSQLRSGYSIRLNSYRRLIGVSDTDLCPECRASPHTTNHIFSCAAKPTTLRPLDLWTRPKEVIAHLVNLGPFSDIPPAYPPALPPPSAPT